jgi:hypothetical protein
MLDVIVYKAVGPTVALSVGATAHAGVLIVPYGNEQVTLLSLLNTGATVLAVDIDVASDSDVAIPGDGASADYWILPANMTQPIVISIPVCSAGQPVYIMAIGSAAGPGLLYARPVASL